MAGNPLYPIVPCHRVVGADMSLVGYGGKQTTGALTAKLSRLQAEARAQEERRLRTARREAERVAADRMQLRLF